MTEEIIEFDGKKYIRLDIYESACEMNNGLHEFNELLLKGNDFTELKSKLDKNRENFISLMGDEEESDIYDDFEIAMDLLGDVLDEKVVSKELSMKIEQLLEYS